MLSIIDVYPLLRADIAASALPGEGGEALIEAGKAAFPQTHTILLTTAAGAIAMLAAAVFFTLAGHRSPSRVYH